MSDDQTPKDSEILRRCMSRFQMRLAMHRMGIRLQPRPQSGPTDEEYQQALADAEKRDRYPPMAMLPNEHHPGARCSCRDCCWNFPDLPEVR